MGNSHLRGCCNDWTQKGNKDKKTKFWDNLHSYEMFGHWTGRRTLAKLLKCPTCFATTGFPLQLLPHCNCCYSSESLN